ncbi:MAG TPA: energy transducer TonB [Terriglobales bacterium]|nr:energy transducer TonB [Terriglobales bacterium]
MAAPDVNNRLAPVGSAGILPTLFGEGYGTYRVRRETFVLSFILHLLAAGLIVASSSFLYSHREEIKQQVTGIVVDISPYILPPSSSKAGGGGGGGDRDKLAATKGALPKSSREQITPPAVVVRNEAPKLAVDPSVVVPPNIPLPHTGPLGDPLSSVLGPPSNGTGSGGGIGSGSGGGVGSGRGPGVGPGWGGGIGGGPYRVGGGVSAPKPLFTPDPEYSEEARKSKYQGVVVLWLVIGPDGRPHEIRVARPLGMGLDEKAIEAVRTWRFEPAKKDGQPVAVQMNVEVSFRLY